MDDLSDPFQPKPFDDNAFMESPVIHVGIKEGYAILNLRVISSHKSHLWCLLFVLQVALPKPYLAPLI